LLACLLACLSTESVFWTFLGNGNSKLDAVGFVRFVIASTNFHSVGVFDFAAYLSQKMQKTGIPIPTKARYSRSEYEKLDNQSFFKH